VIDERGCVRHDWYVYCARAPVGTRDLIDYRIGNVSERERRKTRIAKTTRRMRTKDYGCDDGRRREDLAEFQSLRCRNDVQASMHRSFEIGPIDVGDCWNSL
jgi:hypothetical protein